MFTVQDTEQQIAVLQPQDLLANLDHQAIVQEIQQRLQQGQRYFVIDLSLAHHISSSGLNLLISLLTRVRNAGGELVIAAISEKVQQLLLLTRLRSVFEVRLSVEDALLYLRGLQN